MLPFRAFQIACGFGAGNIGDELMGRAFWQTIPREWRLRIALFPEHTRQRAPYPQRHEYVPVDYDGNENVDTQDMPGLLVGTTPVTESEGLHFPLQFLARRLAHFHECGLPVHALGVGVDRLESPEALAIFREAFLPVRSWTVRTEYCRQALVEMGVAADRVKVGADWAWLYRNQEDKSEWAAGVWRTLGIESARPLLVANVVSMIWDHAREAHGNIARAFDELSLRHGFQIAFFCNEFRDGDFFDFHAAHEIAGRMRTRAVVVPNEYYSPDEAIALLRHAKAAVSQRYHFTIQAILAGAAAVCLTRGRKMRGLCADLGLEPAGSVDRVEADALVRAVLDARPVPAQAVENLRARASRNLHFLLGSEIFVLQSGGLGDLVLLSPLLESLRQSNQGRKIVLACREPFAEISPLYPYPPNEVVVLPANPYDHTTPSPELSRALEAFQPQLENRLVGDFIAAEFKPTWLSWYLAVQTRPDTAWAVNSSPAPRGLLRTLVPHIRELTPLGPVPTSGSSFHSPKPRSGHFVCFPLVAPAFRWKAWPLALFTAILRRLREEKGLEIVLTGEVGEEASLSEIATAIGGARVFAGGPRDLAQLAELVATARGWLGNDTGPMHLAQAYHTPGVAIFGGGGGWPAYAPWAPGTIGLVNELPCFGCSWDCPFGRGLCVETIPAGAVWQAVTQALEHPPAGPMIIDVKAAPPVPDSLLGEVSRRYRAVREQRDARLDVIIELENTLARRSS
jgi:polysaccharide pyruvyl transferase WcaK-like protein